MASKSFGKALLAMSSLVAMCSAASADDREEIRELLARIQRLEAKVAKQQKEEKAAKAQAVARAVKEPFVAPGIAPVIVTFRNGLSVETVDKDWSFKLGGRLHVDGGASSQPFNGKSGNVGIRRAQFVVEGKAAKVWFYKFMYDFAGTAPNSTVFTPIGVAGCSQTVGAGGGAVNCGGGTITSLTGYSFLGGFRDLYFGTDSPLLTTPLSKYPAWIMIGEHYEPGTLERLTAAANLTFIERSKATDLFAPNRHLGVSIGLRGDSWTWKGGFFSTSLEDKALAPPAATGAPFVWAVGTAASSPPLAITRNYAATGGGQYWDATTRFTVAPLKEEDRLIHLGAWFRYHKPNDATAANDDRVMTPGANLQSEANILGERLIATPDLSCGFVAQNYAQTISRGVLGGPLVSGNCVKDVQFYGFETAEAWGPFSVQGEYMHSHYNRDANQLLYAAAASAFVTPASATAPANGVYVPGGTSVDFTGYYVYGSIFLTGESRAAAYSTSTRNGAAFEGVKVLHPFSEGGWGAWEVAARFTSVNLNSGPISGQSYVNAMNAATLAGTLNGASLNNANLVRAVANAGVVGGRQNNFTLGLNWYAGNNIRVLANWVRVTTLSAPFDRPFEQGAHPNLFLVRTAIDW